MIMNPMLYKFEAKVSPISHVFPVKNFQALTDPIPPLFVIKGVSPLKRITPAITKIKEAAKMANPFSI